MHTQCPSTARQSNPASLQVPPQVGYGSAPMQGSRQRQTPPIGVHSVPASVHVPLQTGAPAPSLQKGGRHVAGKPGAGPKQVQPFGQPPQGSGGGPVKQAQFSIVAPPQPVKVSVLHAVPAGQSPSPQLG